jgi:hypothetical protein
MRAWSTSAPICCLLLLPGIAALVFPVSQTIDEDLPDARCH